MFDRLLPQPIDNTYRGHRLALWLLALVVSVKIVQSVLVIFEFPLCGIYEFDADDRIAGERIYYDRGAVLGQLGLFHEPSRGLGRVVTALGHPVTIARAYLRRSPHSSTGAGPPSAA